MAGCPWRSNSMRSAKNHARACLVAILLVFAALSRLGASLAHTAELPTIVLVADHADASIIATLRAELAALGMRPLVVPRGEQEITPGELTEAARQNHAIAAFRVLVEAHRVEVWLADRVTGKVLLREVLMTRNSERSSTDESTVVARAVELLRASLLELDIDDRPRAEIAAPVNLPVKLKPPTAVAAEPDNVTRWGLAAGIAVLAASPHATVASGLGVAVQWHPSTRWTILARATVPFGGVDYTAQQGRAELTPRWASLGGRYSSQRWHGKWQGAVEAGLGVLLLDAVGIAQSGYLARSSFEVDPVAYLGAEMRYYLSKPVAFSFGILGGPGLRPSRIVFDDQLVDRYGRWLVISQLGLDLRWN